MKNKKINFVSVAAIAVSSLLTGCSEDVYDGAYKPSLESHYLSVYPRDFEFGSGEETKTGSISSENAWSFTGVPAWLSVTPANGKSSSEFSVSSSKNEAASNRTATFFVETNASGWSKKTAIVASQKGATPYITFPGLESTTLEVSFEQQEIKIQVASNIEDLKVEFPENWANVSYDKVGKEISVMLQQNETATYRTGRITVTGVGHNLYKNITISQHAPNITVLEGGELSFDADGGTVTKTIAGDLPWTAATNDSWIEFSPNQASGGKTDVKINVLPSYEANRRSGYIYFYFGETERCYVSVTQAGRYIKVSKNEITLSAAEASQAKVSVESNIEWTVSSSPDWITVDQQQGNAGHTELTIEASENNSLNSRAGTIVISDAKTGGIRANLTVTQKGIDFGNEETLEFNWHQSSISFEIPLPSEWNAAVSDGWITLSDYSGNGSKTITVSVSKNDAENPRTGKIILTSEGKRFETVVVQGGQYIKIDNTSGEFTASGGTLTLTVASSVSTSWAIEYASSDNWITANKESDGEYILKVDKNPSLNERSATFKLTPTDKDVSEQYAQGVMVRIKQIGRTLSCDVSEINLSYVEGKSQTYNIVADGEYTIAKDSNDTWFTLTHSKQNNTFYITATANSTNEVREGKITISLVGLPAGESLNRDIVVRQNPAHMWVDLGLPSGLKWATFNVGATSPEEYGDYFAWGETQPKSSYTKGNSKTYGKSVSELQRAGIINGAGVLNPAYDAARTNWGGTWRMPTKAEFGELLSKCTWTWTTQGGKNGYRVTGPNGNSIFLPAAGYYYDSTLDDEGERGDYWSSTVVDDSYHAYYLYFYDGDHRTNWYNRSDGRSVRAVSE